MYYSKDDLMISMKDLTFSSQPDPYKAIPSKVKSALTREYGKRSHTSQGLFQGDAIDDFVKKAKAAKNASKIKSKAAKNVIKKLRN